MPAKNDNHKQVNPHQSSEDVLNIAAHDERTIKLSEKTSLCIRTQSFRDTRFSIRTTVLLSSHALIAAATSNNRSE
jgi:hypothetical protein